MADTPSVLSEDLALIDACKQGEDSAWDALLAKYKRLVFSIPLRYGLRVEDAADITQITFILLMQNLDTLGGKVNVPAWLTVVAKRHSWRVFKRTQRESGDLHLDDEDFETVASELGKLTVDPSDRWLVAHWIDQSLAKLSGRCRDLLLALYFDLQEPSYAEIAERFGMPSGSIGPTRARCLEQPKRVLQDNERGADA